MRSRQGFTLIELLIVIAIIGILMTSLIPNLIGARARARDAAAQQCAREVLIQAEIFYLDHSTYIGFGGSDPYLPRSCTGGSIAAFTIDQTTSTFIAGTVTSLSGVVFEFSSQTGIARP